MRWFHPLRLMPVNKWIFGVNIGRLWSETALLRRELGEILKAFASREFKAIVDMEVPFAEGAPRARAAAVAGEFREGGARSLKIQYTCLLLGEDMQGGVPEK